MSVDEQRIAIAEWCGWRIIRTEESRGRFVTLVPPKGTECPDWPMFEEGDGWKGYIPDYLNDLNAMHEAERGMSNAMCDRFECHLQKILTDEELKWVSGQKNRIESASRYRWHASAAQRAEALLRTIGRWTDSTLHTKG